MMDFFTLLTKAKHGSEECIEELIEMYQPLLCRAAIIDGEFNEDLYQELHIVLLHCLKSFQIR